MWSDSSTRTSENLQSATLNCICPECSAALEVHSHQFRCLGRCGKQWRLVWETEGSKRGGAQRPQAGKNDSGPEDHPSLIPIKIPF